MSESELGGEAVETAPASTEAPQTEAPQQPDLSRFEQRLDELSENNRALLEQWQQFNQPEDDEPYPLSEEDDGYEEQEAQRLLEEMIEQRVQQHLSPIQQQQAIRDRDNALGALEAQYPELADQKIGREVLDAAVEFAEMIGNPELVNHPAFARVVEREYKSRKADERAAQETPAGSRQDVALETGGGAAPQQVDEDDQDRILRKLDSRKESNLL